ncbi:MAG: phenylacetate--CoA ligase family protein [Saprospiraceae bacterium]|nr:phenylacetate--CoA ligase family protein [Saprospiraceae bacterium]
MSLLTNIYSASPVALQNTWVSAYGLYWRQRRYGGIFKSELKGFKDREAFSASQWEEYQTQQLRKLLVHGFENVPYYRYIFEKAGWTLSDLQKIELPQLSQLPLLEKNTLREKGTSELLARKREKGGAFYSSSGSTGTPTQILYSLSMHQKLSAAYEARVRNWAGVNRFQARGMIGGRRVIPEGIANPPYYRFNRAEKQLYLSAYHISAQTTPDYLEGINRYGCEYLVGYAMSHFILARFMDELGLEAPKMNAVLTSSEKLTAEMRKTISRVYQCKVFDAWSGVENCGLISESEYGQLLVSPDVGIVEVVKEDGMPCKPGETGEIVCTGFLNYDQPLIRYRIGDMARLAVDQHTRCGRVFPVIEEITGRLEDTVIGKDGREMVRFHGIFVGLPHVVEGQIVQNTLDDFTINIVAMGNLSNHEKEVIEQRMKSQLGEIHINFNLLNEIPRGANGKFKAVVSEVERIKA